MQIQQQCPKVPWKSAPFIRFIIPLLAGILVEKNFPLQSGFLVISLCVGIALCILCISISIFGFFSLVWISGLVIHLAFFSLGRMIMSVHQDIRVEQSACYSKSHSNWLLVKLLTDPVSKKNAYKSVARITWLTKNQTCYSENEKLLVYFSKKTNPRLIIQGGCILIKKPLRLIENFKGSDFDYKKYCSLRHIYSQVFLSEPEFELICQEKEKSVFAVLETLRNNLLIIIKTHVPDKAENGLLEALMVGFMDDLDPVLLQSYADTGVMHIIAISGLHLALICHILQLGLNRFSKQKTSVWIKFIILISCLWGYSFLSGASPSVIRAAVMFSLMLFAGNISREAGIYNSLAASAFLLICFDPYWLWDTGFQLSYAAVLSLGLFSKPVRSFFHMQNKILATIWDAVSVSIAAQILTTPISIYYFHRFPTYFLVANLLAVPLSSGILLVGMILCACSWIPFAGPFLGWLIGIMIKFMNGFIHNMAMLPGAVIPRLAFSLTQLVLVYFIIFCFFRFLQWKEKPWLIAGLGALCVFQLLYFV